MFTVTVDKERLEYDIHSLVKAFYPGETVRVLSPASDQGKAEEWKADIRMKMILKTDIPMIVFLDEEGREIKSYTGEETGDGIDKNGVKAFLYRALQDYTGKSLPWGNLTGIRPTKIAMGMLNEGKTDEEIERFMKETHFVSDEKAKLSIEIAHREGEVLKPLQKMEGYSLYIGIPFCPTTCMYCSFASKPISSYKKQAQRYVNCVCREMAMVAAVYMRKPLESIYIGGGTPTAITKTQLEHLLDCINNIFDLDYLKEFTVEAGRPDSFTASKLKTMKKYGVTRISVNPQTMKDETLRLIGRRHTAQQVRDAFALARNAGFDNINMDIILGLPGEGVDDVRYTVEEIKKLDPDSLTVHSLAVKRASKLKEYVEKHGIACMNNTEETMALAEAGARDMGMKPYYLYRQKNMSGNFENVGYAKEGKYGIYNILMMEEVQTIMAVGAGSISKVVLPSGRIVRSDDIKDVDLYMEKNWDMLDRKFELVDLQKEEGWL